MSAFSGFDHVRRRREIDADVKAAAARQMMSRPKRDVLADYERLLAESKSATKLPTTERPEIAAQQPAPGNTGQGKVVVGLPAQPGGLRPVSVDGTLVGHAQRVPKEVRRPWGVDLCPDWAYKSVTADKLDYFESLAEIRAHVLEFDA